MPAAMRGGSQAEARPRGKSAPDPKRGRKTARPSRAPAAPVEAGAGRAARWAAPAAAGLLVAAAAGVLATGGRAEGLRLALNETLGVAFGKLGLKLAAVHVQGASAMATPDIVRAAGVYRDQPMIGLDLEALRRQVEKVGWVKQARVVRLLPDTLLISVEERKQLAVWQTGGRTRVIDDQGRVIPEADPARFPKLPLVVGTGGAAHADAILRVLAQRPRLMAQMDALVRVDDRRWDLRLKDGSLIQLPAVGEEEALLRLEQLDQRSHILQLGFERIDLRNPDVVAVRPRPAPKPGELVAGGV